MTQVFVRLKAFGIDPMNGAMQDIVDQVYKLGDGVEEVQGISLALGQAQAEAAEALLGGLASSAATPSPP
ncbi:hypothetical protein [Aeromonas sp. 2HA2]|uniref:hypothetical protein n=1 Tax=Aeromonas sp. 2HA2 TaxID=2699194 RepID=UPI0023DDCF43|nr:hypothetical protein [Aeromonas sp. 2HA2]